MHRYTTDSRQVQANDIFICLPNGEPYIQEARDRGAKDVVNMSRQEFAKFSSTHFKHPSKSLSVIGITGTNGKTTVSYLVHSLLELCGCKSMVIGTLFTSLTTPESFDIQEKMANHLNNGGTHFVMEVSSHGIDQHRVDCIDFNVKCLTNITQDHLDYHKTFEAYKECKERFIHGGSDSVARITPDVSQSIQLPTSNPLLGSFNEENLKAAIACMHALGFTDEDLDPLIPQLHAPPGRFESIEIGQPFTVIVDYAHTPDGLKHVLETAKDLLKPNAKLYCVFGCGGDRDNGKRPKMGQISESIANVCIITDDNPRTEDPQRIATHILSGFSNPSKCIVQLDRKKAIKTAFEKAKHNDIVLIAGKGHETTQTYGTTAYPFDDRDICRNLLQDMNYEVLH